MKKGDKKCKILILSLNKNAFFCLKASFFIINLSIYQFFTDPLSPCAPKNAFDLDFLILILNRVQKNDKVFRL